VASEQRTSTSESPEHEEFSAAGVKFIGGAVVGFDPLDKVLDRVCSAMAYAGAQPTAETPVVHYRYRTADTGPSELPRFIRNDPLRPRANGPIGVSVDDLIDDLHLTIALHATSLVFIHAGLVSWDGLGILVPGRSRTGKSTLVEALVKAGATYYSDEYACVQSDGLVAPYPRPIHLRAQKGRRLVDAHAIGSVAHTPVRVGLIVFTSHVTNAPFDPKPITPASAALGLFDNTVVAQVQPERATETAAALARGAYAVQAERPEASSAARTILDLAEHQAALVYREGTTPSPGRVHG